MWRLRIYIALTITAAIFIVAGALCGIQIIFSFVHESGSIGKGHYGTWQALSYVLLKLPSFLQIVIPMVGLLGSLMGLGLLAGNSELIAMRAAGISIRQIAGGVLLAGLLVMCVSFALTAYVGPKLQYVASVHKTVALNQSALLFTSQALWLKNQNNFVYVGKSLSANMIGQVTQYNLDHGKLRRILSARSARYEPTTQKWTLFHATQLDFLTDKVQKHVYAQLPDIALITPQMMRVVVSDHDELTLASLYAYIHYRQKNALAAKNYQLQFWQTFMTPVSCLIMILLAIPFVFGPLRSATFGLRLLAGIATGFLFYLVNQFFGSYSVVYHWPPFWGATLPNVCFALMLFGMLWWIARRL